MLTSNCDIFIPVRLNSSRLPQKHLQPINGKPALMCLIDRLRKCNEIRHIVVCTTNEKSDDPLIEFLDKEHVQYFRGNEKDILQRFLDAAKSFSTEIIIDVEGDKIYTDPFYVDKISNLLKTTDIDFAIGNDSPIKFNPSNHFIHGFVPAGIRKTALDKVCKLKKTHNTETGYREFFLVPGMCKYQYLLFDRHEFSTDVRLTLDYKEDLGLAQQIFKELGTDFAMSDVLQLFNKKPELISITKQIVEKWELNYEKHRADLSLMSN